MGYKDVVNLYIYLCVEKCVEILSGMWRVEQNNPVHLLVSSPANHVCSHLSIVRDHNLSDCCGTDVERLLPSVHWCSLHISMGLLLSG